MISHKNPVPIVDLFAGPGGLGEGFSSLNQGKSFRIAVSAEMDPAAHQTLRLRAYFRMLAKEGEKALEPYYRFCNGESETPYDSNSEWAWDDSGKEARQLTLGDEKDNQTLNQIIEAAGIGPLTPWVLIGGPPCQAYSLVGRSRNQGKKEYRPEEDHRHYLYKEYLRIIQQYSPAVFVMENVKGILSSEVNGQRIFHSILNDLVDPDKALGISGGLGYRIHSLVKPTTFIKGMDPSHTNLHDFIIRAEEHGIPQARHRVILLGVREDLNSLPGQLGCSSPICVGDVISDLPHLRSKLSKEKDSFSAWQIAIQDHLAALAKSARKLKKPDQLVHYFEKIRTNLGVIRETGGLRLYKENCTKAELQLLKEWYTDRNLMVWLNHESRGHMSGDLRRYLYAASFAQVYGRSPKGHLEFDLEGLRPDHENWESGKFADRFRVQLNNRPSTTVTSHISKDGHYFIHPDPAQCRSLTVREAARLQTFPDNYFFQGNRTQQFHQAGNAVPPLLAHQIAFEVVRLLNVS